MIIDLTGLHALRMCNCALLSVAPPTTPGPWLAVQCASAALDCDTRIIQRQTRMDRISEEVVVLVQRDKAVRPLKLKKGRYTIAAPRGLIKPHLFPLHPRKLHLDRLAFCADGALGHCYGSCFQVDKQHLVPLNEDRKQGVLVEGEMTMCVHVSCDQRPIMHLNIVAVYV